MSVNIVPLRFSCAAVIGLSGVLFKVNPGRYAPEFPSTIDVSYGTFSPAPSHPEDACDGALKFFCPAWAMTEGRR